MKTIKLLSGGIMKVGKNLLGHKFIQTTLEGDTTVIFLSEDEIKALKKALTEI